MNRLNLVIKVEDISVHEQYYMFMKSSKLWSDINFVSVRIQSIDKTAIPVERNAEGKYEITDKVREIVEKEMELQQAIPNEEISKELALSELDKVFGIKNFDGTLLKPTIDYIDASKTVNAITYYRHYFYVITSISEDMNRLIGLRTIELIPLSLMINIGESKSNLHESYNLSNLVRQYINQHFWRYDPYLPLQFLQGNYKNRIGVLFSDLKGFGQLVKNFPSIKESESTQLMIKKYQHLASHEIKSNGGYVVQTAGDAFMAIFKLPAEKEANDVEEIIRILKAALGILSISKVNVADKSMTLTTRIGINIAANIEEGFLGALDLREYTVFGKDVNIASRLEKKVDELSETIDSFAGGLLLNIYNCKETIPPKDNDAMRNFADDLIKVSNDLSVVTFRNRIIKFINNLTFNYETDVILEKVKEKLKDIIKEKNKDPEYEFVVYDDLKEIQVKEGTTTCIFIYKRKR